MSKEFVVIEVGGHQIYVDAEDYPILSRHKWHISKQGKTFYAHRNVTKNPHSIESMHNLILGKSEDVFKKIIDHEDGNGLNNRKKNLRFVSKHLNALNQHRHRNNDMTGIRNVKGKWLARITLYGKEKFIGSFHTKDEAINARLEIIKQQFGE